jgi:hypothetical protein
MKSAAKAVRVASFRISSKTAPLIIEPLRHYARAQVGEPASFKVERRDFHELHVEEIVASANLILVAKAAFKAAAEQFPGARLTLRQGIGVIEKTD